MKIIIGNNNKSMYLFSQKHLGEFKKQFRNDESLTKCSFEMRRDDFFTATIIVSIYEAGVCLSCG